VVREGGEDSTDDAKEGPTDDAPLDEADNRSRLVVLARFDPQPIKVCVCG
jgi:hypothetical protein